MANNVKLKELLPVDPLDVQYMNSLEALETLIKSLHGILSKHDFFSTRTSHRRVNW